MNPNDPEFRLTSEPLSFQSSTLHSEFQTSQASPILEPDFYKFSASPHSAKLFLARARFQRSFYCSVHAQSILLARCNYH